MQFTLGFIAGVAVSCLIFIILAFFRAAIEQRVRIVEKSLETAGPRPKGHIFVPDDDAEIERKEIIERNRREGKDTPLSQLR